ncbi:hypothetical protein [Legionella hackeliae]|uniref:Lipoprotein n=1 Tax=Legionella hackeliae TaxID=449 RepID=A0A0A8URX5_LEGHA|nr:hypothetical protein [Legionella hackeliae]KTD13101.1 hypothetical protein Lhac_0970 [Legionella hackeliae]CEK11590.1 conserved exported protein of unknown function [Legionella hackeliae]STX48362.1 Uncharacterised protein [Legionella hackeliae]
MKKLIIAVLVFVPTLFLSGCYVTTASSSGPYYSTYYPSSYYYPSRYYYQPRYYPNRFFYSGWRGGWGGWGGWGFRRGWGRW